MEYRKVINVVVIALVFTLLIFVASNTIAGLSQSVRKVFIIFGIYSIGMTSIVLATRLRKKVTPDEIYGASGSCGIGGCGTCASKDLCKLDLSKIDLT